MATVNKIKVGSTIYDVSPSPTGTLDNTKYTSGDTAQSSATSWTSVNQIVATETNASIFTKITQMIRNVRYLYNLIGTGTFSTTNTITKVVNNKANATHSHTTAQLPTSNTQINSTAYVPTSALVYSMNQTLNELNDALSRLEDTLIPNPNTVYDESHSVIATLSNTTDTNQFCNTYNHDNKYNGLKLGNIISIYYNGSYTRWYICGFDVESNKIASDGKSYDNGYGIMLIPETYVESTKSWNSVNNINTPYISSTIHTTTLPTIANNLKTVLGDHLVNRNVLLSNGVSGDYTSSYIWTTAYCTLPSAGQLSGSFASNHNKYDDGEANYKLPLFDHMEYNAYSDFWLRGIWGDVNYNNFAAYCVNFNGVIGASLTTNGNNIRPLIYIR